MNIEWLDGVHYKLGKWESAINTVSKSFKTKYSEMFIFNFKLCFLLQTQNLLEICEQQAEDQPATLKYITV